MTKAYLQNKKAQYYYVADNGKIALGAQKKELQTSPEAMELPEEAATGIKNAKGFAQTLFIFRNDGCRILSWLFFSKGNDADCILTLEQADNICGNLDFSTARIYGTKEIRINCMHF
jgi:hypothetical protein